MEIEMIPLETELSTQIKKNPASQRPLPIDVSFVGFGGSLVLFDNVLFAQHWLCH